MGAACDEQYEKFEILKANSIDSLVTIMAFYYDSYSWEVNTFDHFYCTSHYAALARQAPSEGTATHVSKTLQNRLQITDSRLHQFFDTSSSHRFEELGNIRGDIPRLFRSPQLKGGLTWPTRPDRQCCREKYP